MNKQNIKRLVLEFPHGASPSDCDFIASKVGKVIGAGVSEGGFTMTYMPITAEEEEHRGCEFEDDEMTYIFGYERSKK